MLVTVDVDEVQVLKEMESSELYNELIDRNYEDNFMVDISSDVMFEELIGRDYNDTMSEYFMENNYYADDEVIPEYYSLTTGQEKEKLKRYLCDVLDLNYHTDINEITNLLNTKLK